MIKHHDPGKVQIAEPPKKEIRGGGGQWGLILGTLADQADLVATSLKHAAITVSAPIDLTGQAIKLVNDAAATVTEIDTGVLANVDTVVPTSKAVTTAIAAGGGMSPSLAIAYSIALG